MVLPYSALVRSRTVLPKRMFRPLFAVVEPVKVVGGPPAYLTRGGKSTVKNRTETRLTAPMFRAK
jgi:hypothetical protein